MGFKLFLLFIFLVAVVIIGVGVYFYFFNEKQINNESIRYTNINIQTQENKKNIKTGYIISLNSVNSIYANGTTLEHGFVLANIPENNTIYVRNFNIDNQTYYTEIKKTDSFSLTPKRISLDLVKPGLIEFKRDSELNNNCSINVTVLSKGEYRHSRFCVKYSMHIIKLNIKNTEITKPQKYSGYDKCYELGFLNSGDSSVIQLSCSVYNNIDQFDYIDFVVYDRDIYETIENAEWDNPTYYKIQGVNINNI